MDLTLCEAGIKAGAASPAAAGGPVSGVTESVSGVTDKLLGGGGEEKRR